MNVFRRLSNRGLVVLLAAVAGAVALAAALAVTAFGGGDVTPPPEPLAQALHDAATAPSVAGVTARISFTNHLLGSDALGGLGGGSSPLLGASGRLWATNDGHLRLELQSDAGDAQIVTDGQKLTVYDGTSNTAYELTLPQQQPSDSTTDAPPTLDEITNALASFGDYANLSSAVPDSVAGQPAYTVTATPKDAGGLVGGGEVSWDASTGVPLHVAIDARGSSSPVLDLSVTDISYGSVPMSHVDIAPPAGAKLVTVPTPSDSGFSSGPGAPPVTGLDAVAAAVPFDLVAPETLNGLARSEVRQVGQGALITYGEGLGTIVVHEAATKAGESGPLGQLPTVSVGGVTGHELVTALGSAVAFDKGGVSYTVAGSVTQADAESAARALGS
jgi:outer membrane lipoprotein-sorting protein